MGAQLAPCAIVRPTLLLSSFSPIPSPFLFLLLLPPFYGFITALHGFFCRLLWVTLQLLWRLTSPFCGLRLLDGRGFLMWLGLSLWHMIWRLLPTRALPLERFRSESLILYPPCLRLDLFKHLIVVCPYAWIAWPLLPWLYRFEQQIIRSVEDWFSVVPACHLLIWTSLAIDALTTFLVVCKSHVLGPFVAFFVVAFVVYWVFMCFCNGFLPRFVVLSSVFEDLVAGRLPFLCILVL